MDCHGFAAQYVQKLHILPHLESSLNVIKSFDNQGNMKRSIKFSLFPQKLNGELAQSLPIRMRVSYAGYRVDFRVGYSIEPERWNEQEGRVIANAKNRFRQPAGEINKAIVDCEQIIEDIFVRFEHVEKRIPLPAELKSAFDEAIGKIKIVQEDNPYSFYKAYEEFMESTGRLNDWTNATYLKFYSLQRHLENFDKDISIDNLSEDTLQRFIKSMQSQSNLRNTTIAKYISMLRWFLRWASQKGIYKGNLHQTFKPKFKGISGNAKEVIYLEWEELINLYSFRFPPSRPALTAVRDVFCFCCFTGLRYSDVAKLRRSDVKKDYIVVVTQKTTDGLIIELNKYSRAILEKYKDAKFPNDKALPVISNAKMNDYLKVMGELAGISEPIRIVYFKGNTRHEEVLPKHDLLTTHCGRRTFIVNGLRLGVPAEVIMKWTGHSDYNAMKPYIKIVDKLKAAEMDKFNHFPTPEISHP